MRILMTGSHGFVGTNLIKALSGEHEILRWDVRVDQPLPEVNAVIHLAGLAHDTKHTTEADAYFRVNTALTVQIYHRFLASSATKFIFFSSIKAQDGDTPYAQSKKRAEEAILSALPNDKQVFILRPCMMHGPGNKGNLKPLFQVVRMGIPWPLAAFQNQRSLASIGNVSFVVRELLRQDVASGVYNVCDDEAVSTNELVEIMCNSLGKKARLWRIPKGVIRLCARMGDVLHLPLNSERLGKLTENYVVDNTPIKQALGITKMPVRARDGFKSTINDMIKNQ